jgi:hypothetical protein
MCCRQRNADQKNSLRKTRRAAFQCLAAHASNLQMPIPRMSMVCKVSVLVDEQGGQKVEAVMPICDRSAKNNEDRCKTIYFYCFRRVNP